jgi:hypothetical protein
MIAHFPRLRFILFCLFSVLALLLGACSLTKGGAPVCEYEQLTRPELTYPEMYSVIDDTTPTITWDYPESECIPDYTTIEIFGADREYIDYMHGYAYPLIRYVPAITSYTWEAGGEPGHSYTVWLYPHSEDDRSAWGGLAGAFTIGPLCEAGDALLAPTPLWFPDDWTIDPTPGFELEWVNSMTCWPGGDFVVQLSRSPAFTTVIEMTSPMEELWVYSFLVEDLPIENCARYYWRVRAEMPGSEAEPWSEVRSFVTHVPMTICPGDLFGPWLEDEPIGIPPSLTPEEPANCRSGPTLDYPILSVLPVGGSYEIRGRNLAGDSWQVLDPAIGAACWVYGDLVQVTGDTDQVSLIIPPLPPEPGEDETPAAVDCSQYSTEYKACIANPACTWQPNLYPSDPCRNK